MGGVPTFLKWVGGWRDVGGMPTSSRSGRGPPHVCTPSPVTYCPRDNTTPASPPARALSTNPPPMPVTHTLYQSTQCRQSIPFCLNPSQSTPCCLNPTLPRSTPCRANDNLLFYIFARHLDIQFPQPHKPRRVSSRSTRRGNHFLLHTPPGFESRRFFRTLTQHQHL